MATDRYRFVPAPDDLPPHARRFEDVARSLSTPPSRARAPVSVETRAKLSAATFAGRRAVALAEPDVRPLKLARLNAGGSGWSVAELARRAIVAPAVIAAAEAGERIGSNSWHRLARALGVDVEDLRP